jgi:hypothetical protein
MRQALLRIARLAFASGIVMEAAFAQSGGPPPGNGSGGFDMNFLHSANTTRIADPKLDGGGFDVRYLLNPSGTTYDVTISALDNGAVCATIFQGSEYGSNLVKHHFWDGKDANGKWIDPGAYTIRVEAKSTRTLHVDYPVDVVRLGLTVVSAESSSATTNEWQVVYFMKNGAYRFYATPATGEWKSIAVTGDLADLDLNDGTPRPAPAVHTQTDEAVLEQLPLGGYRYAIDSFNYPICYLAGAKPQFTVTFGATCIDSSGAAVGCNYPVTGYDLRVAARDEAGRWVVQPGSAPITPGGTETLQGPALTTDVTRTDRHVEWHWQYRATGASSWTDVPGAFTTEHWLYSTYAAPYFASGATGTQYAGPWAEILDYMYNWQQEFAITPTDDASVVELLIKGFNGQPTLDHAIEGVEYDCYSNGGDGGATHYFDGSAIRLSHLLNTHADGLYVNCTDCASSTSSILGMLGIQNVQMERLGSMTLRAIWGIGCPKYTLDLWSNGGGAGHGFSYHHIITRDAGTDISDACLWVDEDGDPNSLPGTPGYNNDRDWNGYESLLAHGNVNWQLDILPKIK